MAKKDVATRRIPGYQIESEPRTRPPEGRGPIHTEPIRWYLEEEGLWTGDRKRARIWPGPSEALRAIREFRERVDGVEVHLVPVGGGIADTSARA